MVIAQFTREKEIKWMHEGISGILQSGKTYDFPEARAKFILNKLQNRGVVQMVYNEDPSYKDQKKAESEEMNDRFWQYQIESHNRHNESLKAANKPYVRPPRHVIEAAEYFGIDLIGPWKLKPPVEKVQELANNEVIELRNQVAQLTQMVMKLTERPQNTPITAAQTPETGKSEDTDVDVEFLVQSFKSKPKKQLEPWIKENYKAISEEWPAPALNALYDRYESLTGSPLDLEKFK